MVTLASQSPLSKKEKKMRTRTFLASLLIAIFCLPIMSGCATRQGAIQQLQSLSDDLRDNASYYTIKDWENAANKLGTIRKKMAHYDYTPAERRQIGELEGQCVRYMVEGAKNKAINGVMGIGNEVRGILEGLGISY